ncbi:hypothetical protein FRC09_010284 [Ceratobasidium sp. 395]|nr:hypothetical protein FRC09_010284 [Ceratobasidium sp. 395]
MARTSVSPRRSPRHSVTHQSLSPRRSPRKSTLHEFAAERSETPEIEVELHVYHYHPPLLDLHLGRSQHGPLYYRTIPKRFNPFTSDGIWSFSPRGGIARTPLLGRKIGDIHASILPGANDATFWNTLPRQLFSPTDGRIIAQPTAQTATQSTAHPIAQPVIDPVARTQPTFSATSAAYHPQPVPQPVAQPIAQPITQPPPVTPAAHYPQPVAQPVTQPVAQPFAQLFVPPAAPLVVQPVARPIIPPVAQTITQPIAQPIAQPITQPIAQPAVQPVAQPVVQSAAPSIIHNHIQPPTTPISTVQPQSIVPPGTQFGHHNAQPGHSVSAHPTPQPQAPSSPQWIHSTEQLQAQLDSQHTQHTPPQIPVPPTAQPVPLANVQPGLVAPQVVQTGTGNPQPGLVPTHASRGTSRGPRTMVSTATVNARNPYSRPSEANLPPPQRSKHPRTEDQTGTNNDELQNKRPHGLQNQEDPSQPPSSARGIYSFTSCILQSLIWGGEGFLPNATPGTGSSSSAVDTVQAALHDATRNLAQPRETPGQSQLGSSAPAARPQNMEIDHEEVLESLQSEHDKVLETLYKGSDDGNVDLKLVCRLMGRLIKKQDALHQALQGIKESRNPGNNSGSALNPKRPRRPFPSQPPAEEKWDQSVPHNDPAGKQAREARRVFISRAIREIIMQLLKRADKTQPLPDSPPDEIRYPTENNFGIRWEETKKSIFNRIAAEIVLKKVCAKWEGDALTPEELKELPAQVSEHIRYLCRIWKNAQQEDAENLKKAQLKKASKASRRATLYESRLRVLDRFPKALGMHRQLVTRLGLDGTSSDEEDPVRKNTYLINRRSELSSHVQVLKSKLDLLNKLWIKGPGSKGSQMHNRIPSDNVSTREINVTGLPITCMSGEWLRKLPKVQREFYRFIPHIYIFHVPDELFNRGIIGRLPEAIVMSDAEDEGKFREDSDIEM